MTETETLFAGEPIFVALMMQAVRTSEASVYFNETTHPYIPEGYHLQK
jgi:hypothetical protein